MGSAFAEKNTKAAMQWIIPLIFWLGMRAAGLMESFLPSGVAGVGDVSSAMMTVCTESAFQIND
jgi:hypothetical protein